MTNLGPVETIGLAAVAMVAVQGVVKLASRAVFSDSAPSPSKGNGTLCREHGERLAVIETSFRHLKGGQDAQWQKLDAIDKKLGSLLTK